MFGWEDIFLELYELKQKRERQVVFSEKLKLSVDSSFGIVTFRVGADGVARMIANRTQAVREQLGGKSKITLITGSVEFWNPKDLCDNLVLEPLLGLNNKTSERFFSPLTEFAHTYKELPRDIWEDANLIAETISSVVKQENIEFLFVDNTNSLPYNICASLATVLVSERNKLPVINVCHDFFWEHFNGTRARFAVNRHLPNVQHLLRLLAPWESPYWISVTSTNAAREWLLERGFSKDETDILPYGAKCLPRTQESKEVFHSFLNALLPTTRILAADIYSQQPVRLSVKDGNLQGLNRWIVVVPTKISSGKEIEHSLRVFTSLIESQRIQRMLNTQNLCPTLVVVGPNYDVSEDTQYIQGIVRTANYIVSKASAEGNLRIPPEIFFLKGVPPLESTVNSLTMHTVYSASDVVIFSSRVEMWGLPILDAACYGLPIIVQGYKNRHSQIFDEISRNFVLFRSKPLLKGEQQSLVTDDTVKSLCSRPVINAIGLYNSNSANRIGGRERIYTALNRILSKLRTRVINSSQGYSYTNNNEVFQELCTLLSRKSAGEPFFVVTVVAPPGWGKSTLATDIVHYLNRVSNHLDCADTLSFDDYGLPLWEMQQKGFPFFVPESLKIADMLRDVRLLKRGFAVPVPRFVHGSSVRKWRIAKARKVLILEGVFAFWESGRGVDGGSYQALQEMVSYRIFVDTDIESVLESLMLRDLQRNIPLERMLDRYEDRKRQIREYILPFKQKADLIIVTGQGLDFHRMVRLVQP